MRRKMPMFYSAILLTGVNLLLRLVSTSFQVYISGRIGPAGVGLLQLVLSVAGMSMTAAMAGIRTATMSAVALITIGIAVPGLMNSTKPLVPILSLVLGTVIGEALDIDRAVTRLGDKLQEKFKGKGRITEGFVTCTLLFAVGAMTIMGSLDSGLKNDHTILIAKSVIDGISSIIFASTMGVGVAFADRENPQGDIFHDADQMLQQMKNVKSTGCAIF